MEEGVPVFNLERYLSLSDRRKLSHSLPPVRGHGKRDSFHLRPLHLCPVPVQPVRLFLCGRIHRIFQGKPLIVLDMLKTYLKYI